MKKLGPIAFAIMILSATWVWAQSDTRIQFPPGRTTVTLEGKVGETLGNKDYVLRARAGQQLIVRLSSPNNNGRFKIFRTDYGVPYEGMEDPLKGTEDVSDWSGTLSTPGDYHIYVLPTTQGTVPFTLEVTLLQEKLSAADFEGWFELQGKAPKGLEGFEGLSITTLNFRPDGTAVPVKPSGTVSARGVHKMARITISGEKLSFETLARRGVSYLFTGTLHKGNSTDPDALIIKGHLTKSLNGKKMAESEVELLYVEGVD